ncbi:cryptochrome/photolyase family protein [Salisediminibacterium selenitireducens]|nr:cryptochrome/photolyase family protein [Salisediminibacterium selenitireducens]
MTQIDRFWTVLRGLYRVILGKQSIIEKKGGDVMTVYAYMAHQCSLRQPGIDHFDPGQDRILLVEETDPALWAESHCHRLIHQWSIIRHFEQDVKDKGFPVTRMQAPAFTDGLERFLDKSPDQDVQLFWPTDYKSREALSEWKQTFGGSVRIAEETGFLIPGKEWRSLLKPDKRWKLDPIYRSFRKRFDVLMNEENQPVGGKWSYDQDNRKKAPDHVTFPPPCFPERSAITEDVIQEVKEQYPDLYGNPDSFEQPVTARDAEALADHFIAHRLASFGDYQDAMRPKDVYMSHSLLSAALNHSLLDPLSLIRKAEQAYHDGLAPLNAVEGFIRQILGWREYIRGVYLNTMPSYKDVNHFGHTRDLPTFFWDGNTKMACVSDAVTSLLETGYTHHIQRLMILGNLSTLLGIEPKQVSDWFYTMYTDALDWVVLPNVLGMALFADGGTMSTKPYAASGKYVERMSTYCKTCAYNVKDKYGENACPLNSLYWNFLERNQDEFREHPRMKVMYKHLDNRSDEDRERQEHTVSSIFHRLKTGHL